MDNHQVLSLHRELERRRIAFVEQRDGRAAAFEWAQRIAGYYRTAVLDRARTVDDNGLQIDHRAHFASLRPWKPMFIASWLELRAYVRGHVVALSAEAEGRCSATQGRGNAD